MNMLCRHLALDSFIGVMDSAASRISRMAEDSDKTDTN